MLMKENFIDANVGKLKLNHKFRIRFIGHFVLPNKELHSGLSLYEVQAKKLNRIKVEQATNVLLKCTKRVHVYLNIKIYKIHIYTSF